MGCGLEEVGLLCKALEQRILLLLNLSTHLKDSWRSTPWYFATIYTAGRGPVNCFGPFMTGSVACLMGPGDWWIQCQLPLEPLSIPNWTNWFFCSITSYSATVLKEVRSSSLCFVILEQVFRYVKSNYNSEKNNSMCKMVKYVILTSLGSSSWGLQIPSLGRM